MLTGVFTGEFRGHVPASNVATGRTQRVCANR